MATENFIQEVCNQVLSPFDVAMATLKDKWRQRWNSSVGMLAIQDGYSCPFMPISYPSFRTYKYITFSPLKIHLFKQEIPSSTIPNPTISPLQSLNKQLDFLT